jgi:hypothetical protein
MRISGKAPAEQSHWTIRSLDDIGALRREFAFVQRRQTRKRQRNLEMHYLTLYLFALGEHGLLDYPFELTHSDSPDFFLTGPGWDNVGVEHTKAISAGDQRFLSEREKDYPNGVAIYASPLGYTPEQELREWRGFIGEAIEKKLARLPNYQPASRYDLLIEDNCPISPGPDRRRALEALAELAQEYRRSNPKLGKVSVVVSLDVLYDAGGENRVIPIISWSDPRMDDPGEAEVFASRAEHGGRAKARRQIRKSHAEGLPIYGIDEHGRMIREDANGRRFEVQIRSEGDEFVVQELPPR